MLARVIAFVALVQVIAASALTFNLPAKEKVCYYIFTQKPRTSVNFYFAVQSGGDFDVDYEVKGPNGHVILSDTKQRQGTFVFNADVVGEYEFCFSNQMSTFAEKVVDFEIKHEGDAQSQFRASMPAPSNQKPQQHVERMKRTADEIDRQLDELKWTLQYYKTRNNRNQATVRSTESRIYYFSILEVLLMVGMAALQIAVVQYFFKGSRKQLV
ncbi:hypothetical protein CJJ07_005365 [Candidozyma auris]|nr:hypothetical protein CJJ07_005365 [[Candida] auris]QEL62177.1 hypothetical protein CJJ09_004345 [[Candida] auris]